MKNRYTQRQLVVAKALAACFATEWDDCSPRQQQRFKRDANRILQDLDEFGFFNIEVQP